MFDILLYVYLLIHMTRRQQPQGSNRQAATLQDLE